jgi:chromosome condensin MukBEF MukE localization factor
MTDDRRLPTDDSLERHYLTPAQRQELDQLWQLYEVAVVRAHVAKERLRSRARTLAQERGVPRGLVIDLQRALDWHDKPRAVHDALARL